MSSCHQQFEGNERRAKSSRLKDADAGLTETPKNLEMRFILSTLCTSSFAQRICLWYCTTLNRGDCRRMNRSIDGSEIIVPEDNHFRLPVGRDEEEGGVKNHFLSPHSRGPIY